MSRAHAGLTSLLLLLVLAFAACSQAETDRSGNAEARDFTTATVPDQTSRPDTSFEPSPVNEPREPAGFTGSFSTRDERQRCKAATSAVVCASTVSSQRVRLDASGVEYLGETAFGFPAARSLDGGQITTPAGITCSNTSRGIECYGDGGEGFVIGDTP